MIFKQYLDFFTSLFAGSSTKSDSGSFTSQSLFHLLKTSQGLFIETEDDGSLILNLFQDAHGQWVFSAIDEEGEVTVLAQNDFYSSYLSDKEQGHCALDDWEFALTEYLEELISKHTFQSIRKNKQRSRWGNNFERLEKLAAYLRREGLLVEEGEQLIYFQERSNPIKAFKGEDAIASLIDYLSYENQIKETTKGIIFSDERLEEDVKFTGEEPLSELLSYLQEKEWLVCSEEAFYFSQAPLKRQRIFEGKNRLHKVSIFMQKEYAYGDIPGESHYWRDGLLAYLSLTSSLTSLMSSKSRYSFEATDSTEDTSPLIRFPSSEVKEGNSWLNQLPGYFSEFIASSASITSFDHNIACYSGFSLGLIQTLSSGNPLFLVTGGLACASKIEAAITVKNSIPNQIATVATAFNLTLNPFDIFNSPPGVRTTITQVALVGGGALPGWLQAKLPSLIGSYAVSNIIDVFVANNYAYVAALSSGMLILNVADPSSPTLVNTYTTAGDASSVVVIGSYAFVAARTAGLQIINVANPLSPSAVGGCGTSGSAYGIAIQGNYAYVANGAGGLKIIDISNLSAPSVVGSLSAPNNANRVVSIGNYAYLVSGNFQIINVNTPSSPSLVGSYALPEEGKGLAINGNYAYIADCYTGLMVLDISNPSSPSLVSTYYIPGGCFSGVTINNGYAYASDGTNGLYTFDISNPASLYVIGGYGFSGSYVYQSIVSGGNLYIAVQNSFRIAISDPLVHLFGTPKRTDIAVSNLQVTANDGGPNLGIDQFNVTVQHATPVVSNPILDQWMSLGSSLNLTLSPSAIFTDPGGERVAITQVGLASGGALPSWLQVRIPGIKGSYNTPDSAQDMVILGNYLYLANWAAGIQVLNLTIPTTLTLVKNISTAGQAASITVSGNYAYISNDFAGLRVVNVTDPANPNLMGGYDTPGYSYHTAVSGNYAYVADGPGGLQIINVANPTNPSLAGSSSVTGTANGIAVKGNYAYIAAGSGGLRIYNVANPASPSLVGSYTGVTAANAITVDNNYAYISSAGLQIVNISNPASPTFVGGYNLPYTCRGIKVENGRAYLTASSGGLWIFNITNPASPSLLGGYTIPGNAIGVSTSGDYIYIGAGVSSVVILDKSLDTRLQGTPTLADIATYNINVTASNGVNQVVDQFYLTIQPSLNVSMPSVSNPIPDLYVKLGEKVNVYLNPSEIFTGSTNSSITISQITESGNVLPSWLNYKNQPISLTDITGLGSVEFAVISGNYAYLAAWDVGFHILNITNLSLSVIGSCDTPGNARGIALSEGYAYVADRYGGMHVVNVTNLASPHIINTFPNTGGDAIGVSIVNNTAYLADGPAGLRKLNITNPLNITQIDALNTNGDAYGLEVIGSYAYLANGGGGFKIVNVTTSLSIVGSCNISGYVRGVAIYGTYAYLASSTGLHVVNVVNKASPVLVSTCSIPGEAFRINILNSRYAYVASHDQGVYLVDISSPFHPYIIAGYDTPGYTHTVALRWPNAFVTDWDNGFRVLDIDFPKLTGTPDEKGVYNISVSGGDGASTVIDSFLITVQSSLNVSMPSDVVRLVEGVSTAITGIEANTLSDQLGVGISNNGSLSFSAQPQPGASSYVNGSEIIFNGSRAAVQASLATLEVMPGSVWGTVEALFRWFDGLNEAVFLPLVLKVWPFHINPSVTLQGKVGAGPYFEGDRLNVTIEDLFVGPDDEAQTRRVSGIPGLSYTNRSLEVVLPHGEFNLTVDSTLASVNRTLSISEALRVYAYPYFNGSTSLGQVYLGGEKNTSLALIDADQLVERIEHGMPSPSVYDQNAGVVSFRPSDKGQLGLQRYNITAITRFGFNVTAQVEVDVLPSLNVSMLSGVVRLVEGVSTVIEGLSAETLSDQLGVAVSNNGSLSFTTQPQPGASSYVNGSEIIFNGSRAAVQASLATLEVMPGGVWGTVEALFRWFDGLNEAVFLPLVLKVWPFHINPSVTLQGKVGAGPYFEGDRLNVTIEDLFVGPDDEAQTRRVSGIPGLNYTNQSVEVVLPHGEFNLTVDSTLASVNRTLSISEALRVYAYPYFNGSTSLGQVYLGSEKNASLKLVDADQLVERIEHGMPSPSVYDQSAGVVSFRPSDKGQLGLQRYNITAITRFGFNVTAQVEADVRASLNVSMPSGVVRLVEGVSTAITGIEANTLSDQLGVGISNNGSLSFTTQPQPGASSYVNGTNDEYVLNGSRAAVQASLATLEVMPGGVWGTVEALFRWFDALNEQVTLRHWFRVEPHHVNTSTTLASKIGSGPHFENDKLNITIEDLFVGPSDEDQIRNLNEITGLSLRGNRLVGALPAGNSSWGISSRLGSVNHTIFQTANIYAYRQPMLATPAYLGVIGRNIPRNYTLISDPDQIVSKTNINGTLPFTYQGNTLMLLFPEQTSLGPFAYQVHTEALNRNFSFVITGRVGESYDFEVITDENNPKNILFTELIERFDELNPNALTKIRIKQLPRSGSLTLNDQPIKANQEISRTLLESGSLVFTPNEYWFGSDNLIWEGHDGISYVSPSGTITIQVNPVKTQVTVKEPISTIVLPFDQEAEYVVPLAQFYNLGRNKVSLKFTTLNGEELPASRFQFNNITNTLTSTPQGDGAIIYDVLLTLTDLEDGTELTQQLKLQLGDLSPNEKVESALSSSSASIQRNPAIAKAADRCIVVWQSNLPEQTAIYEIRLQTYTLTNIKIGNELVVATSVGSISYEDPSLIEFANGSLWLSYTAYDVLANKTQVILEAFDPLRGEFGTEKVLFECAGTEDIYAKPIVAGDKLVLILSLPDEGQYRLFHKNFIDFGAAQDELIELTSVPEAKLIRAAATSISSDHYAIAREKNIQGESPSIIIQQRVVDTAELFGQEDEILSGLSGSAQKIAIISDARDGYICSMHYLTKAEIRRYTALGHLLWNQQVLTFGATSQTDLALSTDLEQFALVLDDKSATQGMDVYRALFDVDTGEITTRAQMNLVSAGEQFTPVAAFMTESSFVTVWSTRISANEESLRMKLVGDIPQVTLPLSQQGAYIAKVGEQLTILPSNNTITSKSVLPLIYYGDIVTARLPSWIAINSATGAITLTPPAYSASSLGSIVVRLYGDNGAGNAGTSIQIPIEASIKLYNTDKTVNYRKPNPFSQWRVEAEKIKINCKIQLPVNINASLSELSYNGFDATFDAVSKLWKVNDIDQESLNVLFSELSFICGEEFDENFEITIELDNADTASPYAEHFVYNVKLANNLLPVVNEQWKDDIEGVVGRFFNRSIATLFKDPDGDSLEITVVQSLPSGLSLNAGAVSGVPQKLATGTYPIVLKATDPQGGSITYNYLQAIRSSLRLNPGQQASSFVQGKTIKLGNIQVLSELTGDIEVQVDLVPEQAGQLNIVNIATGIEISSNAANTSFLLKGNVETFKTVSVELQPKEYSREPVIIQVIALDGINLPAVTNISMTVIPVNHPPMLKGSRYPEKVHIKVPGNFKITIDNTTFADPDDDALIISGDMGSDNTPFEPWIKFAVRDGNVEISGIADGNIIGTFPVRTIISDPYNATLTLVSLLLLYKEDSHSETDNTLVIAFSVASLLLLIILGIAAQRIYKKCQAKRMEKDVETGKDNNDEGLEKEFNRSMMLVSSGSNSSSSTPFSDFSSTSSPEGSSRGSSSPLISEESQPAFLSFFTGVLSGSSRTSSTGSSTPSSDSPEDKMKKPNVFSETLATYQNFQPVDPLQSRTKRVLPRLVSNATLFNPLASAFQNRKPSRSDLPSVPSNGAHMTNPLALALLRQKKNS